MTTWRLHKEKTNILTCPELGHVTPLRTSPVRYHKANAPYDVLVLI
jgi:hypothetical protein